MYTPRDQYHDFRYLCERLGVSGHEYAPGNRLALWSLEHAQVALISFPAIPVLAWWLRQCPADAPLPQIWRAMRLLIDGKGAEMERIYPWSSNSNLPPSQAPVTFAETRRN